MNNDQKTTVLGVVKGVLYIALSAMVYFFGFDATTAEAMQQTITASKDWFALVIAFIGALQPIIYYYTNKKDKVKEPTTTN